MLLHLNNKKPVKHSRYKLLQLFQIVNEREGESKIGHVIAVYFNHYKSM